MKFSEKKMVEISTLITDGKHGDSMNETNSGYYFLRLISFLSG